MIGAIREGHLRAIAVSILLASSALAAEGPALVVTGPKGDLTTVLALVAFERDGQPLGADIGPFRLVVPSDKRGGRWVRQLVSIKVLD